jgi:hypothetical protein
MESTDPLSEYLKLSPKRQSKFLHSLSTHLLFHLPDGKSLGVSKEDARL